MDWGDEQVDSKVVKSKYLEADYDFGSITLKKPAFLGAQTCTHHTVVQLRRSDRQLMTDASQIEIIRVALQAEKGEKANQVALSLSAWVDEANCLSEFSG